MLLGLLKAMSVVIWALDSWMCSYSDLAPSLCLCDQCYIIGYLTISCYFSNMHFPLSLLNSERISKYSLSMGNDLNIIYSLSHSEEITSESAFVLC